MSTEYAKLLEEREALDLKIAKARADSIGIVWRQIDSLLLSNQISKEELQEHYFPKKGNPKKGSKVEPKFSDGKNQWSGRGGKPRWLLAALEKDTKLTVDSFLIKK